MGLSAYHYRLFWVMLGPGLVIPMPGGNDSAAAQLSLPDKREAAEPEVMAPLDPDQPLTEFPDFGVDWPEMDAPLPETPTPDQSGSTADDLSAAETAAEELPSMDEATDPATAEEMRDDGFQPPDGMVESRYRISFTGRPDNLSDLFMTRFDTLSALQQYRDDEANFAQIKRRAESDRELVERLMKIEGYYDAIVRTSFAGGGDEELEVRIAIQPGPQYRLFDIALPGVERAEGEDPAKFRDAFGLEIDEIINSDEIVAAELRLDEAMAENGYAFAETAEPELVIDHAERSGDLEIVVTPGDKYRFGSIRMEDTSLFDPDHVQLIARFDEGDIYRRSDVEDLRRALIATGLVSTLTLEPVKGEEPGTVDLATTVTAAPLRTIAGAVGYGTGEGLRSEVSWEHRNFFPPEGLLRLTGVLATQEQSGSITYRRNNYRRRDNVLNGRVALSNVDRSAFEARTFSVSANIERQSNLIYQKKWSWSAGVELLASQERDIAGGNQTSDRDTFFIGALPATVTYDASDDLLDPTRGFRLSGRISPEASLQSGSFFYARGQIDGSAYFPLSDKVVLAGRARLGSIVGAGSNRIAPSRRLYAGGGGSVRGFGFQRIGPRDINNDPAGGRSLVEFSLEARIRLDLFGGNFGVVPFVDAGNVYTDSLPDFSGIRYGAGLGLRYYSDFGPIRIDVGTPINPQPGDSRIAVYVSLGQAF